MRRIAIGLVVFATAMAMALPATAAKPTKPPKPPKTPDYNYYTLEITSSVLNSSCTEAIVRQDGPHYEWFYQPDSDLPTDIELQLAVPGLAWNGDPVSGCLSSGVVETYYLNGDIETGPANGYFRITLQDDGTVAMLWIFDIYERYDEIRLNKKRSKVERTERTDFRMGGPYVGEEFAQGEWTTDAGIISGSVEGYFSFVHYDADGDPSFIGLTNGVTDTLVLDFTLTPYDPNA